MFENRIKKRIADGKTAFGGTLPDASDMLAKAVINTGIDFLWIDLEHRPYEVDAVRWTPILCRQQGCSAMVRVAGLDSERIKKALDIGANTIMVPQVGTADEARRAVQYAKYPPEGTRGISPLWTQFMDISWDDYLPQANDETCVVVQIESPEGVENLDEIAAVDGVDVVFAGPMDLSATFGHIGQTDHPEVKRFLEEFPKRVAKAGKAAGVVFATLEECKWAHEVGYRFIAYGNILAAGGAALSSGLGELKKLD
mgnify:CR=1 FL=1